MLQEFLEYVSISALEKTGTRNMNKLFQEKEDAKEANEKLLMQILHENRNTEYGKKYDFANIKSAQEYREKVPFSTYETYAPYISRIYDDNEKNVLSTSRLVGFATSSGSVGKPKTLPLTKSQLDVYTKYSLARFLSMAIRYQRAHGKKVKYARGILALPVFTEMSPHGLPSTNVADVTAREYGWIYPYVVIQPLSRQFLPDEIDGKYAQARFGLAEKDCLFIQSVFAKTIAELVEYIKLNWEMLVEDIENGTINDSINVKPEIREKLKEVMKPDPERAAELRKEFEKGFDETILSRVWPNMVGISTIGTSPTFEPYSDVIKSYSKGIVFDNSVYAASEGLFAVTHQCNKSGQLMLPDSCYYEFIEEDSEDEKILSIDELEVGKNYEIIITNRSGFYRYRFNDVITVLGYDGSCPVINFVYRKGQLLNITGEKTNLVQMKEALYRLSSMAGVKINYWTSFVEEIKGKFRYGILVENDNEVDLNGLADAFEDILRDVNTSYEYYKSKNLIEKPHIYTQATGTHEAWKKKKVANGASPEQVKPVNVLDTEEKKAFFLNRIVNY